MGGECWVRSGARGLSWPFGTVTWAGLPASPGTSTGLGAPGSCLVGTISACAPGPPGHVPLQSCLSRPVLGSRPPSVEDVLQDGGCGEHRSLTQSESDPPVDVYLPGNGRAVGVRATRAATVCAHSSGSQPRGAGGVVAAVPDHGQPSQPGQGAAAAGWDRGTLPASRAPASSQWAERAGGEGG